MPVATSTLADVVAALAERAPEHDRLGTFPHESFDLLHRAGVLDLTVPAALGGGGAGLAETCRVVAEVASGDASVALVLTQHLLVHAQLASPTCAWPAAVRERVQRSSIEGVALINALRVEPDLGSPARGGLPSTVAARLASGAGWRLTGHKTYSTGIPRLRWLAVWGRTDDPDPQVGTFLVEAGTPGYDVVETWDHLGMRATRSDDVHFTGCDVPLDHAVDVRTTDGWRAGIDPNAMAWNCLVLAALYHGVAVAARRWLVGYLHERVPANLGAPLASLPRFQSAVGEIEALLHANERILHGTAVDVDAGGTVAVAASAASAALAKRTVTANAIAAVEAAVALVGNPGLSRRHPLERHYRDVLCSRIHTPQDDSIVLAAGRDALAATPAREQ